MNQEEEDRILGLSNKEDTNIQEVWDPIKRPSLRHGRGRIIPG